MEFDPPPGGSLSDEESAAYRELHRRVDIELSDYQAVSKAIVFCVAYATYKKKKKMLAYRLLNEKTKPAKPKWNEINKQLNVILNEESEYSSFIEEAKILVSEYSSDVTDKSVNKVDGILTDIIDEKILHKGKSAWWWIREFFFDAVKHAFSIIFAAILIALVWYFFEYAVPIIKEPIRQIWSGYLVGK